MDGRIYKYWIECWGMILALDEMNMKMFWEGTEWTHVFSAKVKVDLG